MSIYHAENDCKQHLNVISARQNAAVTSARHSVNFQTEAFCLALGLICLISSEGAAHTFPFRHGRQLETPARMILTCHILPLPFVSLALNEKVPSLDKFLPGTGNIGIVTMSVESWLPQRRVTLGVIAMRTDGDVAVLLALGKIRLSVFYDGGGARDKRTIDSYLLVLNL